MPFRPEAGAPGEIAYQIVSAIFTSFQVSDAKNGEIVLKSLYITKFHQQQQSTLEKKI